MKIIYHHYSDPELEEYDRRHDWWTCPPELVMSKEEKETLVKQWHHFLGQNAYIADPLGANQCNYAILMELPNWFRWFHYRNIPEEHVYDVVPENRK